MQGMQMGSTLSMGSTGSTETESSLESSCGKDSASTSSSVSTSSCEPASTVSFASSVAAATGCANKTPDSAPPRVARACPVAAQNSPVPNTDLGTAITQELQRRAQQVDRRTDNMLIMRLGYATEIRSFQDSHWLYFLVAPTEDWSRFVRTNILLAAQDIFTFKKYFC